MKNTGRKWLIWCVAAVCVLAVCVGAGRELWLNHVQGAVLEELDAQAGEYDEQSIVLTGTNVGRANELAERFSAELRITKDGSFATLTLPEGVTIRDVAADEGNRALLDELSVDYHASISELTGEEAEIARHGHHHGRPRYSVQDSGFDSQSYLDYMNLDTVWSSTQGSDMLVAVIDTGIDTDHPEFNGRISTYSYNATEDKVVKDYDWSLVEDEQGHGTAVAGVIAAAMDGSGTVGLAPQAELLVIKAECSEDGVFYRTSDLVFGLYYAVERGADVVNMSFGTIENVFEGAVDLAYDSDILCVAAAGNDATTQLIYPAAYERVLGVGALAEDSWELADYSNYGDNVNVVAPGTVYTSLMGGGYGVMSGTSFSAPATAGALALYVSQNRYQTVDAVREVLYASCMDLGGLGEDWLYGFGAVDVSALVLEGKGTVTFMMQTDELEDAEQVFVRDHTLQNIPEPERLYAVFDGWYYDPQCTEEYQWYEDVFSADLTLYAKWANEDDSVPYTYVTLDDGTVEIRSYTGHRRYITIPDTIDGKAVTSIGVGAFEGESRLRQVNLPANLKTIGERAFYGCTNLMEIHLPDTVQTIGTNSFRDNTRLNAVELGNGLKQVGDYAFAGCVSLARFELPESLSEMNGSALFGTTALQSIGVRAGNRSFAARDGVLFEKSGTTLVAYPAGKSGEYTVPDSVRTIGMCAFGYTRAAGVDLNKVQTIEAYAFMCSHLTEVTIPDGVSSMGRDAFAGSFFLSSVKLGAGLTGISSECFSGCSRLDNVAIPKNITMLGAKAFSNCVSLTRVIFAENSSLTVIGVSAFENDPIVAISIPASVAVIGEKAFYQNVRLTELTFESSSVLSTIEAKAFAYTLSLTQVELPQNLRILGDYAFMESALTGVEIPAFLTSFGAGTFAACHDLAYINVAAGNANYLSTGGIVYDTHMETLVAYPAGKDAASLAVPDSVRTVGPAAVYGAHKLNSVTIPGNVQVLDEYAFYDCRNVTGYTVAEGLADINSYALSRNVSLRSFAVPDSVRLISRYSFAEDYALATVTISEGTELDRLGYAAFAMTGLTSFRVPANISTMAQGVFEDCPYLQSVTFASGSKLDAIGAYTFDGCDNLSGIVFEPGSALTTISAHGFEGMTKLTSVDFGDAEITGIGNYAFRFCESLTTLNLPDTLVNVGRFAFYGCESLTELTLPEGMEYIGSYAFHGAENLKLYFKADFLPLYLDENWDDGLHSYYVGVSGVEVFGDWEYAVHNSGNISIVGYHGSETSVDLSKLDLGGEIVGIGGHAFYQSTVTSAILPDTLTTIQAYAFSQSDLERVTIPASVNFIGRNAFAYSDVESVIFSGESALRVMEQEAFANTERLTEITLPRSLTTMGSRAFFESGLKIVSFESGIALAEIPEQAFAGSALTSVVIPDSVTKIDHSAFRDCLSLTAMTLGGGEKLYVASNVFYNTALREVHIPANVGYIGEYAFVGLRQLEQFTVSEENEWYCAVDGLLMSRDGRKLIAVPAGRTGSLTVPETVETIGFGAFENSKLSAVSFHPDGNILTLGYRAFYGAENLTAITIPASVVSIDYYAFANCTALKQVAFAVGSRLTGVYEGAFYGCTALSDITLPESIVEISDFAFYGCRSLDRIPLESEENLLGIYDYAFAHTGISGALITPENLIDIGPYAFAGNTITTLTVPDTRQKELIIGLGAFADCGELTEVTLPFIGASFEDGGIGWFGYIFGAGSYEANNTYVPEALKTVTITEGITELRSGAFSNLPELEHINLPHSITTVSFYAFRGTTATFELTNTVYISGYEYIGPDNTNGTYVYETAFSGISGHLTLSKLNTVVGGFWHCDYLEGVTLPETAVVIDYTAFDDCDRLADINIPNGITEIGEHAFYRCASLKQALLPDSVTNLAEYAFAGSGVVHAKLPAGLHTVPAHVFESCKRLTTVVLSEGIAEIGTGAFLGCTGLTEVTLPDSLTTIGQSAFYQSGLKRLTLGTGLASVVDGAFAYAYDLDIIYNNSDLPLVPGSSEYGGLAENAKKLVDQDGNVVYRDGVTELVHVDTLDGFRFRLQDGKYQLIAYVGEEDTVTLPRDINGCEYEIYHMRGVKNVIIPEGFTQISDNAFSGTTNFNGCSTLESIVLPDGITRIGIHAFDSCTNLKSINLPDSITEIGSGAFMRCSALERVTLPSKISQIAYGTFYECISLREIVIPQGVHTIGNSTFYDCKKLEKIFLPSTVNYIDDAAFNGCTALSTFEIDADNPYFINIDGVVYDAAQTAIKYVLPGVAEITLPDTLKRIPAYAFENNTNLKSITIPDSVTEIGEAAFRGCKNLEAVKLSAAVTGISNRLFMNCQNLKEISIPDGVEHIGSGAFRDCRRLEVIALPQSLRSIGGTAFYYCIMLREIDIPENVTSIGSGAFMQCYSLEKVEIPAGITEIAAETFWNCTNLSMLVIPDTVKAVSSSAFYGCYGIRSVNLGNGVETIESGAFQGCANLTEVTLGTNLSQIESSAFSECSNLYLVNNNSGLTLEFGSSDHGAVAANARMIVDADGESRVHDGYEGYPYIDTVDGLRFLETDGEYELIAYLGSAETVTLPADINGNPYSIRDLNGIRHLIIPEGVKEVQECAFYWGGNSLDSVTIGDNVVLAPRAFEDCYHLKSVVVGSGVTLGNNAFKNCGKLENLNLGETVAIGYDVFAETALVTDLKHRENGVLLVDGYLIDVGEDALYCDWSGTGALDTNAFAGTYRLKQVVLGGDRTYRILKDAVNLETLIISKMPLETKQVCSYFGSQPLTLDTVVIKSGATVNSETAFSGMAGITIFVEKNWIDSGAAWDVSCPGWNNGNKVYYGGEWITACFYDVNGDILEREFLSTSQIIRQPYYAIPSDEMYDYTLVGWDINGDGLADHIPATSAVDIHAYPVVEKAQHKYAVTFYGKDGITPIHVDLLPYGSAVTLPADPQCQGYEFLGWAGNVEGMVVTGDISIFSRWQHVGDGHDYSIAEEVAPTCTEPGGTRHICFLCRESYLTDYVAPTGHSYSVTAVYGCDEMGYDLHSCTVCGDSYRDNFTLASGHEFGDWSVQNAATCKEEGLRIRSCIHCKETEQETVPALPHTVTTEVTKTATCTEEGEQIHTCTVCGDVSTEVIPVSEHNYQRQEVSMSFIERLIRMILNILWGYDGDTAYYYICADCGHIQTLEEAEVHSAVSGVGCTHTDAPWTVATAGNCKQQGVEWRVCALCGDVMEARLFGTAGEHGYMPEHVDSESHRLVCSGCGLLIEGAHDWDESNTCTVCHVAGVSAVWMDGGVTVTVYHMPEGAAQVIAAAYGEGGRLMECRIFTAQNGGQVVFDRPGITEVRLFTLNGGWAPVTLPIIAE